MFRCPICLCLSRELLQSSFYEKSDQKDLFDDWAYCRVEKNVQGLN